MPSLFSRVFVDGANVSRFTRRSLPLINEITTNLSGFFAFQGQISKKKELMAWYKTIPELTAFVNKVARDSTSKFHFENLNPKESGRNKIMEANKFSQEVGLRQIREAQFADCLITGEGFGWKGKLLEDNIRAKIKEFLKPEIFIEKKIKNQIEDNVYTQIKETEGFAGEFDEDLLKPRKYRYVPSSTIEIVHDEVDILRYKQIVNTIRVPIIFEPPEMIRFTLSRRDGRIGGFTPVEAIVVQLELLRQMWQNLLSIHKNGGSPDKIFMIDGVQVGTPAYKRIEEQLRKYKLVENKHGHLLFTGKVTVENMQQLDEMQFKESGLYITGLIAMQWGIPKSSIPYILGGTNTKDDTGGNSERGYWEAIASMQEAYTEIENGQLWIPHFGVKLVADNSYVNLDVQRQTALQTKLINVQSTEAILAMDKLKLTEEKRLMMLDLSVQDVEKREDDMNPLMSNAMNNQLSKNDATDSDDKKNLRAKKKDEQESTIASQGMKPTGVGKELILGKFDINAQTEFKQMIGEDAQRVEFRTFIKLYNEDMAFNPLGAPRLFMKKTDDFVSFKFKSSDFIYKTLITSEEFETNRIMLMNLGNKIIEI